MIDAHCHVWQLARGDYGWLDGQDGPLEPLRRDFALSDYPGFAHGVGRVILVQAAPTIAETEYLLAAAERDPRVAGVVGWVDLSGPDAAGRIARLSGDARLRGLRPMLQDIARTDWLATAARPDALAAMKAAGLRLDALVTARHLAMLAGVLRAHPDLPVVIDHAAKPQPGPRADWDAGMAALAALPWVHCKLSGLMTELEAADIPAMIARLFDLFGADRLIWGSDWPVLGLSGDYETWLDLCLAHIPASARDRVMGANAARFYGVTP